MKTYLDIPFNKKHYAKNAGAKWDWVHKKWYWDGPLTPAISKLMKKGSFESRLKEAKRKYQESKKAEPSKKD